MVNDLAPPVRGSDSIASSSVPATSIALSVNHVDLLFFPTNKCPRVADKRHRQQTTCSDQKTAS